MERAKARAQLLRLALSFRTVPPKPRHRCVKSPSSRWAAPWSHTGLARSVTGRDNASKARSRGCANPTSPLYLATLSAKQLAASNIPSRDERALLTIEDPRSERWLRTPAKLPPRQIWELLHRGEPQWHERLEICLMLQVLDAIWKDKSKGFCLAAVPVSALLC